jgi:hypothetical protein
VPFKRGFADEQKTNKKLRRMSLCQSSPYTVEPAVAAGLLNGKSLYVTTRQAGGFFLPKAKRRAVALLFVLCNNTLVNTMNYRNQKLCIFLTTFLFNGNYDRRSYVCRNRGCRSCEHHRCARDRGGRT